MKGFMLDVGMRSLSRMYILPRFLQSYYSREQIFACGNHHLLAKDYSENHDILSKGHILIDLELQTICFNINHSKFINLMLSWEDMTLLSTEVACEQDSKSRERA